MGLALWNAKLGDMVCVMLGCCTPFLLRKLEHGPHHTLVGEAYVHGIMGGEVFLPKLGPAEIKVLSIV
jgi:hypothetical protein